MILDMRREIDGICGVARYDFGLGKSRNTPTFLSNWILTRSFGMQFAIESLVARHCARKDHLAN